MDVIPELHLGPPTKIDYRKKGNYLYCNLSTGGPRMNMWSTLVGITAGDLFEIQKSLACQFCSGAIQHRVALMGVLQPRTKISGGGGGGGLP